MLAITHSNYLNTTLFLNTTKSHKLGHKYNVKNPDDALSLNLHHQHNIKHELVHNVKIWMVFKNKFLIKLYVSAIIAKPCVTHAECMQTMCRLNIQQWLTKYICLWEAGKTPFATDWNDCLSWRCIFQNLQSKSPWQSFSGFPFSLHKTGIWRTHCRYVGSERVRWGSTNRNCFATGLMVGGPVHNGVKSAQWYMLCIQYTWLFRYKKKRNVSKHNSQGHASPMCTPPEHRPSFTEKWEHGHSHTKFCICQSGCNRRIQSNLHQFSPRVGKISSQHGCA